MVLVDGRTHHIYKGRTFAHADHQIVRDHPDMFEPLKLHFDVVEVDAGGEDQGGKREARPPRGRQRRGGGES